MGEVGLHLRVRDAEKKGYEEAKEGLDPRSFGRREARLISVEEGKGELEDVEEDIAVGHAELKLVEWAERRGSGREVESLLLLVAAEGLDLGGECFRGGGGLLVDGLEGDTLVIESAVEILVILWARCGLALDGRLREPAKQLTTSRQTLFHSLSALFHSSSFCFNLDSTIGTATLGLSKSAVKISHP